MAVARASHAASASRQRRTASRAPERAKLAVVGTAALKRRRLRRRARLMVVGAVLIVVATLIVVAGGQALVAARQVNLDATQQALAQSVARNQNLQLSRANLESPARILEIAEQRYGMILPKTITYLAPVNPGETVIAAAHKSPR